MLEAARQRSAKMVMSEAFIESQGKGKSMSIIRTWIDLAKNVFVSHRVDETGEALLVKLKVARA